MIIICVCSTRLELQKALSKQETRDKHEMTKKDMSNIGLQKLGGQFPKWDPSPIPDYLMYLI